MSVAKQAPSKSEAVNALTGAQTGSIASKSAGAEHQSGDARPLRWNFAGIPTMSQRQDEPEANLSSGLRGGQPIDSHVAKVMGSRLAQDFSNVRVHTDSAAARTARSLRAQAVTIGSDIVFAAGGYRPNIVAGQALLAHELVHVAQQRVHGVSPNAPLVSAASDPDERQADAAAHGWRDGSLSALSSLMPPAGQLQLAPETWYRGYIEGAPRSADSTSGVPGHVHDLGGGVYFSDREDAARSYGPKRVKGAADEGASFKIVSGPLDPNTLGSTLDLTHEADFMSTYNQVAQTMTISGEPYRNMVDNHLKVKGKTVDDFAVLIGPEGVNGGRQMRIKDASVADRVIAGWAAAKPKPGGGGAGGSGEGSGVKNEPKAPAKPPTKPSAGDTTPKAQTKPPTSPKSSSGEAEAEPSPRARRGSGAADLDGSGPSLGRNIVTAIGVMAFKAAKTYLLGKLMDDAMAKEPAFREQANSKQILTTFQKDANWAVTQLLASDIQTYADSGFSEAHSGWSFTSRAIAIDQMKDDGARNVALAHLRIDVANTLGELGQAKANMTRLLALEGEVNRRIKAADDLKSILGNEIVAQEMILEYGLSIEAWSALMSNLANYIVVHQIVLQSLHSLQGQIDAAIASDNSTLKKLNKAAEHNAHLVAE